MYYLIITINNIYWIDFITKTVKFVKWHIKAIFNNNQMKNIASLMVFIALLIGCNTINEPSTVYDLERWWTADEQELIILELNRTTKALRSEIEQLSDEQWNFREDDERWSIGEIVEHLEMQNQLHYREISVTSKAPQYLKFRAITKDQDSHFIKYSTDPNKGKSQWFLVPLGRYCDKTMGESAFYKARGELLKLVEDTDIDFRKQFTFRTPVEGKDITALKIGQVRDLHQLLLTGIAHTDRHLNQIRQIKQHSDYPEYHQ